MELYHDNTVIYRLVTDKDVYYVYEDVFYNISAIGYASSEAERKMRTGLTNASTKTSFKKLSINGIYNVTFKDIEVIPRNINKQIFLYDFINEIHKRTLSVKHK